MASNSSAMLFQYRATCTIVSCLGIPAFLQVIDGGRLRQPAVTKTREWSEVNQLSPALFRFGEVSIVAQTRFERAGEAGLSRVDFPGMDVADDGYAIMPGSPHT